MNKPTRKAQRESIDAEETGAVLNPFPATAVAVPSAQFWSIETEALKQARAHLQEFLARSRADYVGSNGAENQGMVLAIVGDYGTGKTHIAHDLLRQISAQNNPLLHSLYLDAPSDSFLALYRERFIEKLDRREVKQRVEEYYADIVSEELERSEVTRPAADLIRRGEALAEAVLANLGLTESEFERRLGERLREVTDKSDFAAALTLLRRPSFEPAVWEWLKGGVPDPILQERGIVEQICDDAAALEAIGVMAFVFGQRKHRFILFIDEVEKVLSHTATRRPDAAAVLALKKLMEAMSRTRALLVLIGLPEFQEFLPADANQRISGIIHPSPVTSNEISTYIREAQRRATGEDRLDPFTNEAVEHLAEIIGGNARRMVRLCYLAYLSAQVSGSTVTPSMLREIVRQQFEVGSPADIATEFIRTVEARGWLFENNKVMSNEMDGTAHRVDFWLPVGSGGEGIAVIISRSILQEVEAQELASAAEAVGEIDAAGTKIETVLILNGHLADHLREILSASFGRIVPYRPHAFRDDVEAALAGARVRLEERNRENILEGIKRRVDEISRQNNSINHQVSTYTRRAVVREELQLVVAAGLRSVFGQLATGSVSTETHHPEISAVFDETLRVVDALASLESLFDMWFGVPEQQRGFETLYIRRRMGYRDAKDVLNIPGLQVLVNVRAACQAFRRGIFRLLESYEPALHQNRYALRESIEMLCRNFDHFAESISLSDAKRQLDEWKSWATSLQGSGLSRAAWEAESQMSLYESSELSEPMDSLLKDLGRKVWRTVNEKFDLRGTHE